MNAMMESVLSYNDIEMTRSRDKKSGRNAGAYCAVQILQAGHRHYSRCINPAARENIHTTAIAMSTDMANWNSPS
ncbi:hypothetical protein AC579_1928 [Pseudocercospora musae]|uniref:Uncharacterized protein n=1 Tax=Pseudocercospora musae TaxID=113226 RepID=A0A139HFK3_9PEZI|nr:hypothetical protein AC579_1928 [Pseudocercospora musae]